MNFIGNEKIVAALTRNLERGHLNHAYIFSGPESVGKFTLAKMFALSAIAKGSLSLDIDLVNKDALLDLILVKPEITEKNKVFKQRDISIESIREAKLSLSLFPYSGKYKVLIVDDAHRLNVAAQNGLLKIMEEPNATTIIILVTHELNSILPTIVSRCQTINFTLVGDNEMLKAFNDTVSVSLAMGRPGLAVELGQDTEKKIFMTETEKQFDTMLAGSLNERFVLADEYSKDIPKTLERMNIWIWLLRKNSQEKEDAGTSQLADFAKIERIQKAANVLKKTNANSKLILETLFMDM